MSAQNSASQPIVEKLATASAGLKMPSESDYPFQPFFLDSSDAESVPDVLPEKLKLEHKELAEERSLDEFLGDAAAIEDWMEDEEKETAKKFAALVDTIEKELEAPTVYLFGERKFDAVIIGSVSGGFAGLVTQVVET